MAIDFGTIWHDWSTGNTANGGGFDPTNVNFAADLTTDANTGNTSSPVVSSASYNFVAGDVGAWLFIQAGTNWIPGWYQIASVASNKATLTAGIGTAVLYNTDSTTYNYQRPNGRNTSAGVATVGTPTAGVWGMDYSQQTTAAISYTDMVIDGTTNTIFTSAAHPVGKNIIGNIINVTAGTGFTVQRVQIVSTSGTQATVDKSLGTLGSTGGTGSLGGAIGNSSTLTAIALGATISAGNQIYLKGDRTITVAVQFGGLVGDTTNGRITIEGFASYPGDLGTKPVITCATNNVNFFSMSGNVSYLTFSNFKVNCTAVTPGIAFTRSSGIMTFPIWKRIISVNAKQFSNIDPGAANNWVMEDCEVSGCTGTVLNGSSTNGWQYYFLGCDFHDNTGNFFSSALGHRYFILDSIFDTHGAALFNLTGTTISHTFSVHRSIFVDNASDTFKTVSTTGTVTIDMSNNVFYNNGGYGSFNNGDSTVEAMCRLAMNRNNAYGSNTSGKYTGINSGYGEINLTADPFVNRAARNFAPNTTAGGGALLRAHGFPGTLVSGTTTDSHDIGIQHTDSGGAVVVVRRSSVLSKM